MKQLNLSEKVGALFFLLLSGSYAFVDIKYVMLYLVISWGCNLNCVKACS